MILLCEGDEVAYRCAFACEGTRYIVHTSKDSRRLKAKKWTKEKIVEFFNSKGKTLDRDYTLEPYTLIEEEYIVNYTLDRMIERLSKLKTDHFKITKIALWLSPSDHSNFRYNVATLIGPKGVGYKAGRPEKPYWLSHIKNRLKEIHGAKELQGYEADDALGMFANSNTVLCHQDKDMNAIEGWHYNLVTGETYYINEGLGELILEEKINSKGKTEYKVRGRGLVWFYVQLLTGDSTDNIPGCKNPAKLHYANPPNISERVAYELLDYVVSEEEAFNVVKDMYIANYGIGWQEVLEEIADLVWICRKENETGRQYLKSKGFIK